MSKREGQPPLGKGELRSINDRWRRNTKAIMDRLNISVRELARLIGASEGSVSEALNMELGKKTWSWVDACDEALRRAEEDPESREHASRPQGEARDIAEQYANLSDEECRNLLAGLVKTMPIDNVHAWLMYFSSRPPRRR